MDEAPARAERPMGLRNGLRRATPLHGQPIWIADCTGLMIEDYAT
jgi:hypothetical protein